MKRFFTLFIITIFCSYCAFAQQRQSKFDFETYKAEKERIITKEANLTEEEAKAFFPLYHEMSQMRFEANRNARKEMRRILAAGKASDEEYLQAVEEQIKANEKEAAVEREYFEKFKKILPPEKVFKIVVAETKLTREMLRKNDRK